MACCRICSWAARTSRVISAARGLAYRGAVDERGLDAGGQQQRGAGWQGADRGGLEDVLAAQGDRLADPPVAVVEGADGHVVLPDEGGQVAGQAW